MAVDLYQILLFLYVLCFVYCLGGDLSVFYSSGQLINPRLSQEARKYVLKVMHWLDQFPRVCMPLVIALGFTMGSMQWFELDAIWLWIIWGVAALWIYFVITLFLNGHEPAKVSLVHKVGLAMQWIIAPAILVLAIMSLRGTGITGDGWPAANLLIWAGTVFCGLASRYTMKPFSAAFGRIIGQGESPEDLAQMKEGSLHNTHTYSRHLGPCRTGRRDRHMEAVLSVYP